MLYIILIFIIIILFYSFWKEHNKNIEQININIEKEKENKKLEDENVDLLEQYHYLKNLLEEKKQELGVTQSLISKSEEITREAFEKYSDALEDSYAKKEIEYEEATKLLKTSYNKIQDNITAEIAKVQQDLDTIISTRAAAIQAQLREQEIKEKESFYSLSIDEISLHEINILKGIESSFRDPRPIKMIIWTSYYTKKANEMIARILGGDKKITGIYKITNKNNQLCYIGQAKDIRERLREHMKFGLGIDTPANNKLYIAMLDEGLESFTFELLEECDEKDLDEKEVFYIKLYNAYAFGYNSNKGNKKS